MFLTNPSKNFVRQGKKLAISLSHFGGKSIDNCQKIPGIDFVVGEKSWWDRCATKWPCLVFATAQLNTAEHFFTMRVKALNRNMYQAGMSALKMLIASQLYIDRNPYGFSTVEF